MQSYSRLAKSKVRKSKMHWWGSSVCWVVAHTVGEPARSWLTATKHSYIKPPLTCRWAGTLPPVPGASSPWGCCGQSSPHRSMPPPWPWAGGPSVSPAAGQSSALQHCSRFFLRKHVRQTQMCPPTVTTRLPVQQRFPRYSNDEKRTGWSL